MKLISIITFIISSSLWAQDCFEHKSHPLNFDPAVYNSIDKTMFRTAPLKLVIEEVSFPTKTQKELRQKEKFKKALSLIPQILNSEEFKKRVISYRQCKGCDKSYTLNYLWSDKSKPLTPSQIYDVIMQGDEKMRPNTKGQFNYNSKTHYFGRWSKNVVGRTYPRTSNLIEHNWSKFGWYDTHQMLGNIVHEWIHLLGFLHSKGSSTKHQVTYVIGDIAKNIAKEILQNNKEIK